MISVKSLRTKKSRDELGVFIVEGEKFVKEIPTNYKVVQYIVCEGYKKPVDNYKKRAKILEVSKAVFDRVAQTTTPQGILAVVEKQHYSYKDAFNKDGFILVCENINDPGNLGSLIRTAAAANASCIMLTQGSASVWNPKVQRASAGAALKLPIIPEACIAKIADYANRQNIPIYAAHPREGTLPYELELNKKFCLILGCESHGLSKTATNHASALVRLPMNKKVESLSVATAGSIIMYEAIRQQAAKEGNKPSSV